MNAKQKQTYSKTAVTLAIILALAMYLSISIFSIRSQYGSFKNMIEIHQNR